MNAGNRDERVILKTVPDGLIERAVTVPEAAPMESPTGRFCRTGKPDHPAPAGGNKAHLSWSRQRPKGSRKRKPPCPSCRSKSFVEFYGSPGGRREGFECRKCGVIFLA
jgi:hypothetical protein